MLKLTPVFTLGAPDVPLLLASLDLMANCAGRILNLSVEQAISPPCVTRIRASRTACVGALMITSTRPLVQAAGGKLTVCVCTGAPVHVERQLVVALNVPPVLLLSMMSTVSVAADGAVLRVKFVVVIATIET